MDPSKSDHHEYCTGGFSPEDLVITGMSGRFPSCDTVQELMDGLFAKTQLVQFNDDRYEKGAINVPYSSCGTVKDLDKFDSDFFCCTQKNANYMDPATRKNLEVCYEAIADAGYDPNDLKGQLIGVYNATCNEDGTRIRTHKDPLSFNLNCVRCMTPNRVSYFLDLKGPSFTVDAACSSSAVAMWAACNDLREGRTEAAIVSGCQLNLAPDLFQGYIVAGIASITGNSRPFDASSDGMIRTEAITACFLQKAKVARRVYATIAVSKFYTSGYVAEGISYPCGSMQEQLVTDVLQEAGLHPDEIDYVEGHGTGTLVGDPIELNALDTVFCNSATRKKPLYVGSVKSNIGHTEASAGLCGVMKSIMAFETGKLPPNYYYENPNPGAPALLDGRMKVVTEPIPFDGQYIPVNSFGVGGTVVSNLLKGNPKLHRGAKTPQDSFLPRLVLFPATTEDAVQYVFDYVKKNFADLEEEFYALMHKLSFTPPFLKPIRGYAVFSGENGQNTEPQIKALGSSKRSVWYVMTGMGCQWSGMGLQFMKVEAFAQSMRRSAAVLKSQGMDLFEILRADKNYLQVERSITPAFVSIAAIQVALVDLLHSLDVSPDGIVGHSTGELICAYADGCCTLEETILSAYWRGKAVESANLPAGGMAAVGMSWADAKSRCPKGIYPACDNASDSVTISGLKEPVDKFVTKLQSENVFARIVNAYGYAFHSEYVHPAAGTLRAALTKLLKNPKPRTDRWVSTSYPESEWGNPTCKVADAEYFVHNLMSSVLFTDALKKIPADAIVVEIGPHFLLQSILKRAIGNQAAYIGLMKRNEPNNVQFLMESLGKLYTEGVNVKVERLYPSVQFPVPRRTPFLSPLFKWNHSQTFNVPKYAPVTAEYERCIYVEREEAYLMDHRIDGRSLFPATGYIFFAWEALAKKLGKNVAEMSVQIDNFKIHRATIIGQVSISTFHVSILDATGHFEISESKSLVASGEMRECKRGVAFDVADTPEYSCDDFSAVAGQDLYDELKMSGYEYGPEFQGLVESNMEGTAGLVLWKDRWISYLDSLLLFFGMINKNKEFFLPTGALSFKIDPIALKNYVEKANESSSNRTAGSHNFPVSYNPKTRICRSVGVEISDLIVDIAPHRVKDDTPTLEEYSFIPYVRKYSPTADSKTLFDNYMGVLNEIIVNLGQASGKNIDQFKFPAEGQEELEEFLDNISEEHVLLDIFQNIHKKSSSSTENEFLSQYAQTAGMDLLNSALLNEGSLRILFEIVLENTHRKLNVAEISRNSFPIALVPLIKLMRKYSHMKLKKSTFVAPKKKNFEAESELFEELNIDLQTDDTLKALETEKIQDVVISSFTTGSISELQDLLKSLTAMVKSNGFVMFFHKESTNPAERCLSSLCGGEVLQVQSSAALEKCFQDLGLTVLSRVSDPFGCSAYLLRAMAPPSANKVVYVEDSSYGWVEELKKEMYGTEKNDKKELIWVVAQDSPINGMIGMVNCLKQEPAGERIRCVFISQKEKTSKVAPFNLDHPFYKHLQEKNLVMNVYKDGSWGSYRHILIKGGKQLRNVEHSFIDCQKYGDLSSFKWFESQVKYKKEEIKNLVHIYYSALNFKDVMLATGKLSVGTSTSDDGSNEKSVLGMEWSGRDPSGRRLCGFVRSSGMATSVLARPEQRLEVPDSWSLEEAATVPVVYATCYYALVMRCGLRRGERVLIHSGTGGIGQAAIHIATSLDCEIYTTVGNEEKRKYLKNKFPQLKDENIGCSRNLSFYTMIMTGTNGEGVDVVLNSLADDKFTASLRCVAESGRFAEIGKYDLALDRRIGMKMFLQNISFHGVFLDRLFSNSSTAVRLMSGIFDMIRDGIKKGVVQPLDRTVFGRNDIEDAFRYMAKGVHVGKVLLKIRDEEPSKIAVPKTLTLPAVPNTYFHGSKVYIVIGGLGGFGIELTKWILTSGGKHVILTSRYGERTPYHLLCLKRWKKAGVDVHVSTLNVEHKGEAEKLLKEAGKIGPVGGIFNSAVVLKDAFMDCQTAEDYREVCAPKALATKNLDSLSRTLCPELDYFVCFSSISCGRGNAGQTNYGYANSVMERICEERRSDGLHGLAIQWGIIGEVGVVHRHMGDDAMIAGVMAQSVSSCLVTLDTFCQQSAPVVTSYVTASTSKKSGKGDWIAQLVKILGLNDISEVNTNRSFNEMGIDSMAGVEMKQLIESQCDISVTMQEIQDMKIDDVKALFEQASTEKKTAGAQAMFATTVVKLPQTLLNTEPLVVLNTGGSGTPLFIVNVGDNEVKDFSMLAQTVGRPVYGLVWTRDAPTTDMKSLAEWYLKLISSTVSGPFHILGHSLGGSVAFEMALQGEKSGDRRLKTVTLVEGSTALSDKLAGDEVKDVEIAGLCSFVSQFASGGASRLEEELKKQSSLDQRIKTVLNFLTSSSTQTVNKSEVADAISNYLIKFNIVQSYTPSDRLAMDINLIEDPTLLLANDVTVMKELFGQICNGKVIIHRVFSYSQLSNKEDVERIVTVLQSII